ncbi:MAG: hypothetical protein Q8O43_08545 [Dehalococcoidia bacterium]|nr:hypothetical protein [Dehalococcoidia bacterium]
MSSQKGIDSKKNKFFEMLSNVLREQRVFEQSVVILIGSLARNIPTWRSDVDFLVITPISIKRPRVPVDVHLHLTTRMEFLKKLEEGNDFEVWALKYGRTYSDPSGWWKNLLQDREYTKWPDWRKKVKHARKRLSIAATLLAEGDHAAAEEEYLMAAAHIARALLFKACVFPLSRPEMPAQLREINLTEDAQVLDKLISGTSTLGELKELAESVENRLEQMERLSNYIENKILAS